MATKEKVYALHDFDAENPDEVSFKAGETIIVVEKDDAYGDGWWQGTNPRGETGLFPFSYTTFDRDQAMNMDTSISASDPAILTGGTVDASREANGKGVKATMDDIDNALARMQAGRDDASERTGDLSVGETEDGDDAEDDYEKRAKARAALAVNAAKNQDEAEQAERAEQARLKAQAMRIFEEEEERHRQLLLQKEEERKEAAAKGVLPTEEKAKEAPIPGVDMSDESDSEGSQGPDYDDLAPTHAPLFGTSATPTAVAAGAGALAAGAAAGGVVAAKSGASSNDSTSAPNDQSKGQARPLSPIESEDAHAKRSAAGISPAAVPLPLSSTTIGNTPTQNGIFQQQQQQPHQDRQTSDDRSLDSARVPDSPAPGGRSNFTAPSVGTAPTSFAGTETPKSSNQFATTAQQSPAPSTAGSRLAAGPGGDPHEWTVDQVVEWGRSKGWDEASVVSKFAEHEISGDVLMEMDVNILKEIEISAFGKRFQVANAIKDLKKSLATGGAEQSPMQWSAPVDSSSGLLQQQQNRSVSQPIERPESRTDFSGTNDSVLGAAITGLGVAGGAAAVAGASSQRNVSQSTAPGVLNSNSFNQGSADKNDMPRPNSGAIEPGSASHDSLGNSANSQLNKSSFSPDNSINYSNFNQQHASSPRKRESGGSSTKSPADRTSFFAGLGGQKNRKPAPRVQSGGNSSGSVPNSADAESAAKGTLSRFGLNRLKGGQQHSTEPSPNQDLRNKISLPTGSPTYDAMGDTARRHRLSQFGPATGNIPGFSSNHQKQASVGSSGPAAGDAYPQGGEPRSPIGDAPEGAVMVRIRPVEFEGWMRKKGERYNSWKPRYMALKGSDLVLLRDPSAPKIKGYVNMKGYKVIADENTNPGKYGFKILHESEKPHYFSSDDPIVVREWMKALMKATIGRDTSLPVISSYNNATISLKEAQRMNPPPRPPSPTSRARAQRAAARANKDQLTAKDASVLMGLQSPQERQFGFLQQEPLSSASVEIDTMIDMLDSQRKLSKETQRPTSPASSYMKTQKPSSIRKENKSTDWDPVVKQNPQMENERRLPYARHRQIQHPAPLQLIDLGHSRSKSLPQVEKDESSSSVTNEQFNVETIANVQEHQQEIVPKPVSRSLPPSPPSKPGYNNNNTIQHLLHAAQQPDRSSVSSTFGLADLPAPPPPSHSPEHDDRIRGLLEKQRERVRAGLNVPHNQLASFTAPPTPISKDLSGEEIQSETEIVQRQTASSVESYPTISPSSMLNVVATAPPIEIHQKREKRKSSIFANRRPHSSCGFPKEVESIEQDVQQIGRRKRADSAATSSRYSSNSASVTGEKSASSSPNQSVGFQKEKTWLKRQMEKVKNKSPSSNGFGVNGIQEEPEFQQYNNAQNASMGNGKKSLRPESIVEDQIVFSAMAMSDANSFSPHSRLQSANSEPSGYQSRVYRSSQSDIESRELTTKLKKLFNSSSDGTKKSRFTYKRNSDAILATDQGQPARRRSRSMGSTFGTTSLPTNAGVNKRVGDNEFDFGSTTDSTFCKSVLQDDNTGLAAHGHKGKKREIKNRRKSNVTSSIEVYVEERNSKRFIDQNALLGLYTGKDIKQAEKMAATLAAYASEPDLSPSKKMSQYLNTHEEPPSAISSRIAISPQSSKSSDSNQGFHLPSWSKWRKDHLRQRQSDMIAEKLVAEAESEIRHEEGGESSGTNNYPGLMKQQELSASAESTSWTFRHDSKEYFGKLRKQVNEKVKRKPSLGDSIKPFPTLSKPAMEEKEQSDRKQKQHALFYSLDVGIAKQDIPSSVDSIEEIDSQNDHNSNPAGPSQTINTQMSSLSRNSLPPIPPSHSPPSQQSFGHLQESRSTHQDQSAPSPFRNLLLNRIRNESVEQLHQMYKDGNAETQEQGQNH